MTNKSKRSEVQGSEVQGCLFSLTLHVGQQVFDETTNGRTGTSAMIINILKPSFRYVLLIQFVM